MKKYKFRRVYALNLLKNQGKRPFKKNGEEDENTEKQESKDLWKWMELEGKYDFRAIEERKKLDKILKELGC